MSKEHVTIHIERLILDGIVLPQRQRPLVQVAIEQELARLIAADGVAFALHTTGVLQHVPAGVLEIDEADEPRILGEKIARAVYKGIGQ